MVIDAYTNAFAFFNVFYKIEVKKGEPLTLVMDKPEEMTDVFVNNDKVLSHSHQGTDITIEALEVGTSKVRIMKDVSDGKSDIVRELLINVVDSIQRPAQTLNASFGEPQPK
jgi:hypothetical protein